MLDDLVMVDGKIGKIKFISDSHALVQIGEDSAIMNTIQDKLIADVKNYALHEEEMLNAEKRIDKEARELLVELQKVKGWECMIKECKEHYAKYPKEFFKWCSVIHTDDAVQFVKGYHDGYEYEVLEISFRKSLKDQVRDRMNFLAEQREKQEAEEREKDLMQMERIRKKYNL